MPDIIWTSGPRPDLRASQAARLFADQQGHALPRKVIDLEGQYGGLTWSGRFRFEGGVRWYLLTASTWGTWTVTEGELVEG